MAASKYLLLWFAALDSTAAQPAPTPIAENDRSFRLAQHSFDGALTYDSGLGRWLQSAGSMALRDRVQLLPPVPDRHGLFWNKRPIKTCDFGLQFSFAALGSLPSDGIFALWISTTDLPSMYKEQEIVTASKNWTEGLETAGLDFVSNKADFKGLGVFFLAGDSQEKQSVVALWSDGTKKWTVDDIRKADAAGSQRIQTDWVNSEMVVKVRFMPNGMITGSMVKKADDTPDAGDGNHVKLFTIPAGTAPIKEDYFIGFSGWTGSKAYIQMDLHSVALNNFDFSRAGEDPDDDILPPGMPPLSPDLLEGDDDEWRKVMDEEKRYLTQASQMEAVRRLTKLLTSHVTRQSSLGSYIMTDVQRMEGRLEILGADMGRLVTETEAFDFKSNTFDTASIKEHIDSIGSILSKNRDLHDSKLADVHVVAKDMKDIGGKGAVQKKEKVQNALDQAQIVTNVAGSGTTQSNGIFFVMLIVVGGLATLFLNRMRYYEKKHYF